MTVFNNNGSTHHWQYLVTRIFPIKGSIQFQWSTRQWRYSTTTTVFVNSSIQWKWHCSSMTVFNNNDSADVDERQYLMRMRVLVNDSIRRQFTFNDMTCLKFLMTYLMTWQCSSMTVSNDNDSFTFDDRQYLMRMRLLDNDSI